MLLRAIKIINPKAKNNEHPSGLEPVGTLMRAGWDFDISWLKVATLILIRINSNINKDPESDDKLDNLPEAE